MANLRDTTAKILASKDVGLPSAFAEAMGQKMTRMKESFRPENIVKSLTGSNLLSVYTAKKLGRSPEQMRKLTYGSNVKTDKMTGDPILFKIEDNTRKTHEFLYKLLDYYKKEAAKDDISNNFDEEQRQEQTLLFKDIANSIKGLNIKQAGPATQVSAAGGGGGILDALLSGIAGFFGGATGGAAGGMGIGGMLKKILPFLGKTILGVAKKIPIIGPIILGLFGLKDAYDEYMESGDFASAVGAFFDSVLSDLTLGLSTAVFGEGGVKKAVTDFINDTVEYIKKVPEMVVEFLTKAIAPVLEPIKTFFNNVTGGAKPEDTSRSAGEFDFSGESTKQSLPGPKTWYDRDAPGEQSEAQAALSDPGGIRPTAGRITARPMPSKSAEQLSFTQSKEGFAAKAYKDAGGMSIGYGHFLTPEELKSGKIILPDGRVIDWRNGITKDDANALYRADKAKHSSEMNSVLEKLGVDISKLSTGTITALEDLAYNAGPRIFNKAPKLVAALKSGNTDKIAEELRTTAVSSQGVRMAGLEARANERADMVKAPSQAGMTLAAASAANADATRVAGGASGGTTVIAPTTNNIQQAQAPIITPGMRNDDSSYNRVQDRISFAAA